MAEDHIDYFLHLTELRNRLIFVLVSVAILTAVSFFKSAFLIDFITAPIRQSIPSLFFLSPYEAFLTRLKVSVTSGLILSVPVILTQLWSFVTPGLYKRERTVIAPIVLVSILLFLSGVMFAYFFVIPFALNFFLGFQTETLKPLISIGAYVSFFLTLILVFGCVFLTPVVLVGLIGLEVVSSDFFRKQRKIVIVLVFVLAALLTPTMDIVTQCLMALPLWGLFELSIVIGKYVEKRKQK